MKIMIWKGFSSLLVLLNLTSFGANGFTAPVVSKREHLCHPTVRHVGRNLNDDTNVKSDTTKINNNLSFPACRRKVIVTAFSAVVATSILTSSASPAHTYYDKNYPEELVSDGDGRNLRKERVLSNEAGSVPALTMGPQYKPISAVLWGGALWLLSGSRSNPVATPLANVFYDKEEEIWLKDRNDGLFASLPVPLLLILVVVFVGFGWGADALVVLLADGDRSISLQLAGVSLISGASLELGRIASGEKAPTRDEANRDDQLQSEFAEFAEKRLQQGGNCHRNDVVRSFRRYFAKYRQADSEEYPLTDLEVERLLKAWTRQMPNVESTSAGFYYGIQINKDADVFA